MSEPPAPPSPDPAAAARIGPDHPLRAIPVAVVTELFAILRAVGARSAPAPDPRPPAGHRPPVVLVHGLFAHPGVFATLERRLAAAGLDRVARVGYPSLGITLDGIAARIDAVARPLAEAHGPVDVVGHSLGAVAVRAWIKRFGGARHVRRFVSLAGPHGGTSWYPLAPPGLRDALDPRGSWCRSLAQGPEPVPTVVIRSRYDHQVLPPVRARLDGASEIELTTYGHNGLLFSPEAHAALIRVLSAP